MPRDVTLLNLLIFLLFFMFRWDCSFSMYRFGFVITGKIIVLDIRCIVITNEFSLYYYIDLFLLSKDIEHTRTHDPIELSLFSRRCFITLRSTTFCYMFYLSSSLLQNLYFSFIFPSPRAFIIIMFIANISPSILFMPHLYIYSMFLLCSINTSFSLPISLNFATLPRLFLSLYYPSLPSHPATC